MDQEEKKLFLEALGQFKVKVGQKFDFFMQENSQREGESEENYRLRVQGYSFLRDALRLCCTTAEFVARAEEVADEVQQGILLSDEDLDNLLASMEQIFLDHSQRFDTVMRALALARDLSVQMHENRAVPARRVQVLDENGEGVTQLLPIVEDSTPPLSKFEEFQQSFQVEERAGKSHSELALDSLLYEAIARDFVLKVNSSLEAKIKQLEQQLIQSRSDLADEAAAHAKSVSELRERIKALEQEKTELSDECQESLHNVKSLQDECVKLKNEYQKSKSELQAKADSNSSIRSRNTFLEDQLKGVNSQKETFVIQNQQLKSQLGNLEQQLQISKEDNRQLCQEKQVLKQDLDYESNQKEALSIEIEALSKELKDLKNSQGVEPKRASLDGSFSDAEGEDESLQLAGDSRYRPFIGWHTFDARKKENISSSFAPLSTYVPRSDCNINSGGIGDLEMQEEESVLLLSGCDPASQICGNSMEGYEKANEFSLSKKLDSTKLSRAKEQLQPGEFNNVIESLQSSKFRIEEKIGARKRLSSNPSMTQQSQPSWLTEAVAVPGGSQSSHHQPSSPQM